MKRKTIYLHIGQTKTGTTTLQAFLSRNRAALRTLGVLYPEVPPAEPVKNQHRYLVHALHEGGADFAGAEPAWRFLREQIAAADVPKVVLSEEVFWHLFEQRANRRAEAIRWLASQLAGHDCRIVCYLRRQDEWIESWFNQLVKTDVSPASALPLHAFITRYREFGLFDYAAVLADWAAAFGAGALRIRTFERARLADGSGDAIDDFCGVIGAPQARALPRPAAQQQRLSLPDLEIARLFNRTALAADFKPQFMEALLGPFAAHADARRLLAPAQAEALMRECEAPNRRVAQAYCDRDVLFQPPAASDEPSYEGLSAGDVAHALVRLFIVQQRNIRRLRQQVQKLEAQLKPPGPPGE